MYFIKNNQRHAVSRTQQGRQREPSVKTLRSPFMEALHVEWQKSTPRFASTPERRNENINLNKITFTRLGIELTTRFCKRAHTLVLLRHE